MKASELIEKLKTFDENLILKFKHEDNKPHKFFEVEFIHEYSDSVDNFLIINHWTRSTPSYTVKDFINELKESNDNNYDIGYGIWMDIYNELDPSSMEIDLTEKDGYLIIEIG